MDSGAGITVMGSTYFNNYLIRDFKLIPSVINVSAANKQQMTVNGSTIVNIQIGTLMDTIKFLVINEIGMDIIIGNDQLKKWNTRINYENETITFNNNIGVPMYICQNREEGKIRLEESITLQPNSICQVTVDIEAKVSGLVRIVHTLPQLRYKGMVHVKEGIVGIEQKAQVWLVNQAPYKIGIKKGTAIGHVTSDPKLEGQMEQIAIVQKMTIEAMCQQDDKGSETTVNNRQQDLQLQHNTNIEQHIECMNLSVDTDLNMEQQQQLRQLLLKYAKVFASNPQNPTVTHGVQHSINTGDQQPIKQNPQRVSPAMEELI